MGRISWGNKHKQINNRNKQSEQTPNSSKVYLYLNQFVKVRDLELLIGQMRNNACDQAELNYIAIIDIKTYQV